jgi:hypothetical protein
LVKEFLEAGKRGLAGDTARAATSGEVKDLRRQAQELKTVVAEQALELRPDESKDDRQEADQLFHDRPPRYRFNGQSQLSTHSACASTRLR